MDKKEEIKELMSELKELLLNRKKLVTEFETENKYEENYESAKESFKAGQMFMKDYCEYIGCESEEEMNLEDVDIFAATYVEYLKTMDQAYMLEEIGYTIEKTLYYRENNIEAIIELDEKIAENRTKAATLGAEMGEDFCKKVSTSVDKGVENINGAIDNGRELAKRLIHAFKGNKEKPNFCTYCGTALTSNVCSKCGKKIY